MYTLIHPTPTGLPLSVVVSDSGVVLAAGFTAQPSDLTARMHLDHTPPARLSGPVHKAIADYLDGNLQAIERIELNQPGTEFQQQVWQALQEVPAGTTASYAELARAVGRPSATRAVGSACGRNLIAPFVPCHRATRSDGTLGGYYYGLPVKDWLLRHEAGQD